MTALGHTHPRVTAAIHAQVDRLIGPVHAIGFAEPTVTLGRMLADTLPDPLDSVLFLNSGSEAIDGAIKLARRVTGRPAIIAFRGAFHGRTIGATSVTSSSLNYRIGYEPLLPGVYFAPFPAAYPEFDGDEARATASAMATSGRLLRHGLAPSEVAAIVIEPVQGEGGYYPAPAAFLRGLRARCDEHGILLVADEVQSGYGRTGRDVGVRACRDRPGRGVRRQGDRQRPAAVRARDAARAPGALGQGRPRHHVRREPGRLRGRHRRPRDDPRRATWWRTPAARGAELSGGLRELMADDPSIGDVRGPGLMIGVEFVKDRADARAGRGASRGRGGAGGRGRAAAPHLRHQPPGHPLDPAA